MAERKPLSKFVTSQLWATSAGRCQYKGCNKPLWKSELSKEKMNTGYRAHIYPVGKGNRYDKNKSRDFLASFDNLMLMCDECHRKIDAPENSDLYPADLLVAWKKDHTQRIEMLTSIIAEQKSTILMYTAKIGTFQPTIHLLEAVASMTPNYYPRSDIPVILSISDSPYVDSQSEYWRLEEENLRSKVKKIAHYAETKTDNHLSVFAIAPQPLLILLGSLLTELYKSRVYQRHRDSGSWTWQSSVPIETHIVHAPLDIKSQVALVFSLSATIHPDRIQAVLGPDVSIWTIMISSPSPTYLQNEETLADFQNVLRTTLDKIKVTHDQAKEIHLFPAMPVAAAVATGKIRFPKADLPFIIWDENKKLGGFHKTITIGK